MKINQKKLAEYIGTAPETLSRWKKDEKKKKHLELLELGYTKKFENGGITINGNNNVIGHHNKIMINGNDICEEICTALQKLPDQKQKKFYHKIMLELFEEIERN
jgi:transcriptional regulator with XRE-family HTH domain